MKTSSKMLGRVDRVIARERSFYGFILTDDYQRFYFHCSAVEGKTIPKQNDWVEFLPLRNTGGKNDRALRVRVVVS